MKHRSGSVHLSQMWYTDLFFCIVPVCEIICLSPLPSRLFKQRRTSFTARYDFQFPRASIFQFLCVTHFCAHLPAVSMWLWTRAKQEWLVLPFLHRTLCAAADCRDCALTWIWQPLLNKCCCATLRASITRTLQFFIWLSAKTSLILKEVFKAIVLCYLCTGQQHSCNPNGSCITSTKQGLCWALVVQTDEFCCQTSATKPTDLS